MNNLDLAHDLLRKLVTFAKTGNMEAYRKSKKELNQLRKKDLEVQKFLNKAIYGRIV